MVYIVTARKWRPVRFDQVVGQEHIVQTLKNAVRLNRIHHAYLFAGPRGVGKTTTARILARAVNCSNPEDAEPCNQCFSCTSILSGTSLDVIEIDGASNNSVDDIRNLRENAKYPPINGKYKIYIIDEVHMLSTSAFNALLKILEEPPKHLIFIFATTEPHKVLPTITSRCQRFDFHRMEIETIVQNISKIAKAEGVEIDEMSLFTIAKKADGSMRDAQSIFDQFVSSSGKKISYEDIKSILHLIDAEYYFKVSDAYLERNSKMAFEISQELTKNGYDYSEFISGLLEHFRNLLYVKVTNKTENLNLPEFIAQKYFQASSLFNFKDLLRILNLISQIEQQIKFASMPKIRLELLLLQIIEMPSTLEISELINEIKSLKNLCSSVPSLTGTSTKVKKEPTPKQITSNETQKDLDTFLEKYNSRLNGLKTFISSELLKIEFRGKQIILFPSNEVVHQNVKSKERAIRIAVKEFFGSEYDIIILHPTEKEELVQAKESKSGNQFAPKHETPQTANQNQQDTEIQDLLTSLFNAREIPFSK